MYYINLEYIKPFKSSRRGIFLLLLLFLYSAHTYAQHDTIKKKSYSIEFQIFANTSLSNETAQPLKFEYDLKRTLIIYRQQLSKNFNLCLAGDTYVKDDREIYNRTPYLKRAYLQYHNQDISVSAGLLVSEQFKFQRKIWQLRYIDKTFQNEFSYGENRNIGILLKHKLNKRFSYDIAITSGYFTPIKKSSKKYQLLTGQTLRTDFCTFRLFNSISLNQNIEHILSLFITKETGHGNVGIEAAKKSSNNALADEDKYGFSVFGYHTFYNNFMLFARYDMNKESIKPQAENILWTGIQYSLKKHLDASVFYKNIDFDYNYYGLAIFIH